jgi:hypothetical protein
VTVSGAKSTGITGKWYIQTQGQALHNIQVDPSNPNNIHACAMMATDLTLPDDTLEASFYPSRRVYYVFSSDGGATWTAPKAISGLRTGYPAMVLLKRNDVYVPVIAAHRNVSESGDDVMTCLFIEAGNPGEGNFVTVEGARTTYAEIDRDVIWPSLALSNDGTKAYVIAAPFSTPITYLQFGWFTFSADKKDATFSGWKPGPAANDVVAYASGGNYCIRVSAAGKLGVVWQNYDYDTPDLGLYYSESANEGTSWSTPNNIYFAHGSSNAGFSLIPASGLDLMFDGEEPVVAFTGYLSDMLATGGSYVPATGSLLFWRQGDTQARLLMMRADGTTVDDLEPLIDASWLAAWINTDPVDPGGANLEHCTMGIGSDPKKITIFFESWVQDDVGELGEFPSNPARSAAPYHSIWKITTLDGGATWKEPVPVYANDLSGTDRVDYRSPGVSTFNPSDGAGTNFHISFTADDAAGDNTGHGENNFSDITVFFAKSFTAKAKKTSAPTFSLEQNYPNPVVTGNKSIIPLMLANTDYVTVSITDVMGRELTTVFSGQLSAGSHELPFSTQSLAAGMYQYIVKTGDITLARSFTVVQ